MPSEPSEKALRWFEEKFKHEGLTKYEEHFAGKTGEEEEPAEKAKPKKAGKAKKAKE